MNLKKRFSESDLQRIKEAVRQAEDKISGEIVPVLVERSASYENAIYKGAILLASLGFLAIVVVDRYVFNSSVNTIFYDPGFMFLVVTASGFLGAGLINYIPGLKRFFAGKNYLQRETKSRAENAFLEEQVFNTRQRTGIMIFISFFEHEVIVMADQGINKVVDQQQWNAIVKEFVGQIKQNNLVGGLETAILTCGKLLLEKGFLKTADDVNELGDDLRLEN